jgi:hypothetical protein
MTPYTIRKPDVLITEDYQNACGDTCAAGWIAVQTGMMDAEQAFFDQAGYDEAEWTEHLVLIGLDPAEVTRLSIRNDACASNEARIENLRRFVENSPILHWDAGRCTAMKIRLTLTVEVEADTASTRDDVVRSLNVNHGFTIGSDGVTQALQDAVVLNDPDVTIPYTESSYKVEVIPA